MTTRPWKFLDLAHNALWLSLPFLMLWFDGRNSLDNGMHTGVNFFTLLPSRMTRTSCSPPFRRLPKIRKKLCLLCRLLERQTCVIYTGWERVGQSIAKCILQQSGRAWQAYELESRKPQIRINRLFQIRIAVYQLAKLRILEFWYDFLDGYFHNHHFKLIHIDTDSNYISADQLEDIVHPELRTKFESTEQQWLAWTSEVGACWGCSNLNANAAGWLRYVWSATSWQTRQQIKRS